MSDVERGKEAGNINVTAAPETLPLSQGALATSERHQRALAELEKKKTARQIAVPTDDNQVRGQLRDFGEAICMFGETIPDRRERLRELLARKVNEGVNLPQQQQKKQEDYKEKELFYTEGSQELKEARTTIAKQSLQMAHKRIKDAKRKRVEYEAVEEEDRQVAELFSGLKTLSSFASNIGDNRPMAFCQFSPDSSLLATASWSGNCRVWELPNCHAIGNLQGHQGRATSITWHPQAGATRDDSIASLVSSSSDATACLWARKGGEPLAKLEGHTDRVNRALFHPFGSYVATTSHDNTWRLWDVETQKELLRQEGHSRAVYGYSFQCDGSFACSSGLEGVVRVWDLRSGKNIHDLVGHVKQVLSVDVSSNGYHIASGSDDRTAKIWDMRKMKAVYTIPAHSSLISTVRWQPGDGHYLATAAYDKTWKLWSTRDWSLIKTLPGHEGRVMCVDASRDGKYFASSSFDRTWKLWHKDD